MNNNIFQYTVPPNKHPKTIYYDEEKKIHHKPFGPGNCVRQPIDLITSMDAACVHIPIFPGFYCHGSLTKFSARLFP